MVLYRPGICNIGKKEIRRRYILAALGFVVSAIAFSAIVFLGFQRIWLPALAVPLFLGFEGFYQGRFGFCAGFAAVGAYDFAGSGGSRGIVSKRTDHRKDIAMANRIHMYSAASSICVTALLCVASFAL